jgi:hypothetical protein
VKRTWGAVIAFTVASILLAACGSSSPSKSSATTSTTTAPTTTTTISESSAASTYLTAVALVNAALSTFATEADAWTSSTTDAQAAADAKPAIAALQTFTTTLTNDEWPADTVSDIHTEIEDTGALTGDLQGLSTINMLDASTWSSTFERDEYSLSTAVGLVRHDLGLPPATPN